jgi:hypothetical protein
MVDENACECSNKRLADEHPECEVNNDPVARIELTTDHASGYWRRSKSHPTIGVGTAQPRHAQHYADMYSSVPPNVSFFVDDLEDVWDYSTKFDFIFSRFLTGSIRDWPKFFNQSFE